MSDSKNFLNELLKIHYENASAGILLAQDKQTFFPRTVFKFAPSPYKGHIRRLYARIGEYRRFNWCPEKRANWYKVSSYSQIN